MPKPLPMYGRVLWDRHALDQAFDRLSVEVHDEMNPWDKALGEETDA